MSVYQAENCLSYFPVNDKEIRQLGNLVFKHMMETKLIH